MDSADTDHPQHQQDPSRKAASGGGGRLAGSTADLFPKLVAMQRQSVSAGFAVLDARAQTLLVTGKLTARMVSPGAEDMVADLVERQTAFLLTHLSSSPRPLLYVADPGSVARPSPAVLLKATSDGRTDLLMPVNLGAMGNGYVAFFGVGAAIDNELLMDVHRKSLSVMREAQRLAYGVMPARDKLNDREIECLQLVGNGMKSEAIGERLDLSVHTVNAYLGSATTKLDAVNRIQAIAKAIRLGIIA